MCGVWGRCGRTGESLLRSVGKRSWADTGSLYISLRPCRPVGRCRTKGPHRPAGRAFGVIATDLERCLRTRSADVTASICIGCSRWEIRQSFRIINGEGVMDARGPKRRNIL